MGTREQKKQRQIRWLINMSMDDDSIFFQETYTMMCVLEEIKDIECDQLYVKKAKEVIHQLGQNVVKYYALEDGWHWHIHSIVEGSFPLENLPDHVRDLARNLYYNMR